MYEYYAMRGDLTFGLNSQWGTYDSIYMQFSLLKCVEIYNRNMVVNIDLFLQINFDDFNQYFTITCTGKCVLLVSPVL